MEDEVRELRGMRSSGELRERGRWAETYEQIEKVC